MASANARSFPSSGPWLYQSERPGADPHRRRRAEGARTHRRNRRRLGSPSFPIPSGFKQKFDSVKQGAAKAGRTLKDFPVAILSSGCVLRDGESITSPRVVERVGPFAVVFLHALWESSAITTNLKGPLSKLWERYRDEHVAKMKTPAAKRYLEVHEGHLIYMRPGEERYIEETLVRTMTLTGRGAEIVGRLKALEAAGVKQVAIQVVYPHGREMIEDFSREVIAKY